MTPHCYLCVATVGPIQGFIEAARRTRDLWCGSALLSDISRAVALSFEKDGGTLIFPHPESVHRESVSNIIWASFPASNAPQEMEARFGSAKAAAQGAWLNAAKTARDEVGPFIVPGRWDRQLDDVVEFCAAYLPMDAVGDYRATRRRLTEILAARKASRDFRPWQGEAKVPKSSLDGARESVWDPDKLPQMPAGLKARLRLTAGEQLDAVGVVKRLGRGARQFPSLTRVAADSWLRGLNPPDRESLLRECQPLSGRGLISFDVAKTYPQYASFPFEGSAVFATRHDEILDAGQPPAQLTALKRAIASLTRRRGQPSPYVAVLAADGDQMGKTISSIETVSGHQEFSRALAGFASNAERIVGEWSGALVYSGGDDVLALLPVDTVIECAYSLRESFVSSLSQWPGPTLSVGVGVGHSIGEDMQDLLSMARAAEKHAKDPDRNALAFHWATRGAEPLKLRYRWDLQPHQRMFDLILDFLAENFPDGAVYQLREMARHYEGWPAANPDLAPAIMSDALRLLGRKVATSEPATLQRIRSSVLAGVSTSKGLERLAEEMILARRFAAVYRQSGRQPGGPLR